jgi:diamine N-acetyltransferase
MRIVKFLEGEKTYLRPVEDKDFDLVYAGKNSSAVRETLFLFAPMTQEQVRAEMATWTSSKEIALFTICRQSDQEPVGQTAFVRIDHVSRAAVFYIAIYDSAFWSQGYGGEATRLMVHYGFEVLNFNRIQLHVCCENENGVKAYQRAGFQIEGTLRQAMYHHDRYSDFYVMGILRQEYYHHDHS